MEEEIVFQAIGRIKTKYKKRFGTPSQGSEAKKSRGVILLKEQYLEGAKDFRVGDKITVVFCFHQSKGYKLTIIPYRSVVPTGVFSTRSPDRPNSVGITVVTLTKVEGNRIEFEGADMLDGTPIIDLKPAI